MIVMGICIMSIQMETFKRLLKCPKKFLSFVKLILRLKRGLFVIWERLSQGLFLPKRRLTPLDLTLIDGLVLSK